MKKIVSEIKEPRLVIPIAELTSPNLVLVKSSDTRFWRIINVGNMCHWADWPQLQTISASIPDWKEALKDCLDFGQELYLFDSIEELLAYSDVSKKQNEPRVAKYYKLTEVHSSSIKEDEPFVLASNLHVERCLDKQPDVSYRDLEKGSVMVFNLANLLT